MDRSAFKLLLISLVLVVAGAGFLIIGLKDEDSRPKVGSPDPSVVFQASPSASLDDVLGEVEEASVPTLVKYRVSKVIDGDTIEVEVAGEKKMVRYIGIDTPETVDPRIPVQCFGKEASNENHRLVEGKEVVLEKDITDKDKYQRLLRYVYVSQGELMIFVNDYLVRTGFARAKEYPPDVRFSDQFKEAENQAKEKSLGLWGKCGVP